MRVTCLVAFAVLSTVSAAQAQSSVSIRSSVSVDESKLRAVLRDNATVVSVATDNPTERIIKADLVVAWLHPSDAETGSAHREVDIPPGKAAFEVPLPLQSSSIWNRLRYTLTPNRADARAFAPIRGIVSLPQIADYVFELKVSHVGLVHPGDPISVYAEAVHPLTRAQIPVVKWSGTLRTGGSELQPKRIVRHDEGIVEFVFEPPAAANSDVAEDASDSDSDIDLHAKISGTMGDFSTTATDIIRLETRVSARFQSDKPIYQPGQIIHLRAVILGSNGRALPSAKVSLHIEDQDRQRLHTVALVASKFGVVQDDWQIPASTDLGTLEISLSAEGELHYQIASHLVRLSRYELPTFSVTATPDRPAYLPSQPPRVTIAGMYLFGKPVPKGHVKIVRIEENVRGYRERKAADERVVAEGDAGTDGSFSAELDVMADREDLQDSERKQFDDLHFAAYYKDPSSGRTEQRKFDVRITREAIHIYLIRTQQDGPLGTAVYVSTAYADGRPASAAVTIQFRGRSVALQTNRLGIGKVVLPADTSQEDDDRDGPIISAVDSSGQTGRWEERYWSPGTQLLRLETARTLHRAGEAVTLQLTSAPGDVADQVILVHALSDQKRIATRLVRMSNHHAEVTFPYQSEFQRTVVFAAWNASFPLADYQQKVLGSRAVIFPDMATLKVTAQTERATYKPGDKVPLRMQVTSSSGQPVEAALGLAVVDQAVLERARTDTDFGHRSWFACAFCADRGENGIGEIRLNDLYSLKPTDAITPELDLVAEALVAGYDGLLSSEDSESLNHQPQFQTIKSQMQQMTAGLDRRYMASLEFPKDLSDLTRLLGPTWTGAFDPWGERYSTDFSIQRGDWVITLRSSGPDKRAGTSDDFVAGAFRRSYLTPLRALLEGLLKKQEDYPANTGEFSQLLRGNGFELDTMRDAWGTPYRVKVETFRINRSITFESAGPDRKFDTGDDFRALTFSGGYFQREGNAIAAALQNTQQKPQDIDAFRATVAQGGIDIGGFRDSWGRPYRVISAISSRYSDRVNNFTTRVYGSPARSVTEVVPVTQRFITFSLRSAGPDGVEGNYDDFDIARFPTLLNEESTSPGASNKSAGNLKGTGGIAGKVVDATGAALPGATVTLISASGVSNEATTEQDGEFSFTSLAPGVYSIESALTGFKIYRLSQVPVPEGKTTDVDIELEVGAVAESVTVTAEASLLKTELAVLSVSGFMSTPRVRQYFPETLLWIPELVTDAKGIAHTTIPLADSVTTWKIAVIASTLDGRIAETESDLRAFQPFFVDLDTPLIQTKGDQIEVPVTVRNYQKTAQTVSVTLEANKWSTVKSSSLKQRLTVPPDSSVNTSYVIEATSATENAGQRVTAIAGRNSDAISKSSRVHPDGQEIAQNSGDLIAGKTNFTVAIPQTAIREATRGELRIYPNVASLLLESASSILIAPHGCAEQTISAGYANLVAWRFARAAGINDPVLDRKATANVRQALDSLNGFTNHDGGVRYWPAGDPDVAVTAYALSFLVEASDLVPVEEGRKVPLVQWLEKRQSKDGRWLVRDGLGSVSDPKLADRQALLLTGIVTKSLAMAKRSGEKVSATVLAGAYHHLALFTDQIDEPYMLASFILSALESDDESLIGNAAARLMSLGRAERDGLYWDLQTNSPFYGWGTAGRYETTGLAVSALAAWKAKHPSPEVDAQIRRGLLFLLRSRDESGAWLSTQSTLRAMRAVADASQSLGNLQGQGGTIEVRSNGRLVTTIPLPSNPKATDAILADLSPFLLSGDNQISLTPSAGAQSVLMRFSSTHWIPWESTSVRSSPELRLAVQFDRLNGRAGEAVRCSVKAERVGFRGYGMMLAEIGLPPGAEVDRASLETLLDNPTLGVDHYEVLPDRVVLYLWPKAGGSSFYFAITPRLPMNAKSAVSTLYDYYNPTAVSEVVPSRWTVQKALP